MLALPAIVERELRVQARSRWAMLMRLMAGALAVAGLALLGGIEDRPARRDGGEYFLALHGMTLFLIVLVAPILMADSIGRERREGTLPLLFLTRLDPGELLGGKLAAQGLRALTLWLATAPVLLLPLIMGGVSIGRVLTFLGAEALAVALGLLCGAIGATVTPSTAAASCVGYGFLVYCGITGGVCVALLTVFVMSLAQVPYASIKWVVLPLIVLVALAEVVILFRMGRKAIRGCRTDDLADSTDSLATTSPVETAPYAGSSVDWFVRLRILERQMSFPSASIGRKPKPNPDALERWIVRRRLRLKAKAPLVWAALRRGFNAEAPIVWAWAAGSILLLVWASGGGPGWGSAVVFALPIVYASAAAWRRERTEGLFEVMAITPLRRDSFLKGHRQLVVRLFLPGLMILSAGSLLTAVVKWNPWPKPWLLWLMLLLWALPAIGFWISTWCRPLVLGVLATATLGLMLPALAAEVAGRILRTFAERAGPGDPSPVYVVVLLAVTAGLGVLAQRGSIRWLETGGWSRHSSWG